VEHSLLVREPNEREKPAAKNWEKALRILDRKETSYLNPRFGDWDYYQM
jgi:hypothetical protein